MGGDSGLLVDQVVERDHGLNDRLAVDLAFAQKVPADVEDALFVPVGMVGIGFTAGAREYYGRAIHMRFGTQVEAGRPGAGVGAADDGAQIGDPAQGLLQGAGMAAVIDDHVGAAMVGGLLYFAAGVAGRGVEREVGTALQRGPAPIFQRVEGDDRMGTSQTAEL